MKGTVVSVAMEQYEAGDVSDGHRSLGPDLVADAGGSFHLNMTEIGNKPVHGDFDRSLSGLYPPCQNNNE